MHLDQQVNPFIKWLRGWIKPHGNIINTLTRVELMDATLQDCQELLKDPFLSLMSNWHLQLARAYMMHPDKHIKPFLKWLWKRTKYPANRINLLTSVHLSDTTLQICQELLKSSFLFPTSAWYLK